MSFLLTISSRPAAIAEDSRRSGATAAGAVGAIAGLVLGLQAYPATAWFAVLEVAVPAAVAGAVVGFVAGIATVLVERTVRPIERRRAHSRE